MALPRTIPFPKSEVNLLQVVPTSAGPKPVYATLDARSLFQILVQKRAASRPVIGEERVKVPGSGARQRFQRRAILGEPTFRNVIEDGKLV